MNQPNFTPFPVLQSERLTLRKLVISDAADLFALLSDENIGKYIDRDLRKTNKEVVEFINKRNNEIENNKSLYWAIILKKENKLIGTICLWNFSNNNENMEIGYELNTSYRRKGYMDEAVILVVNYGFKELKVKRLEAFVQIGNIASKKLLIKNNFKFKNSFKEKYKTKKGTCTMVIFELIN